MNLGSALVRAGFADSELPTGRLGEGTPAGVVLRQL
jgi:hypothetical protein